MDLDFWWAGNEARLQLELCEMLNIPPTLHDLIFSGVYWRY